MVDAERTAALISPFAERLASVDAAYLMIADDVAPERLRAGEVTLRVPHTSTNDRWLYAFDGRKTSLSGSNESTWPSLNFIYCHNDCVFERCA